MSLIKADLWSHQRELHFQGAKVVAGVDEAGRGPLAGPVVAAAVVLPIECELRLIRDSKTLTPAQRQDMFEWISSTAQDIGIGFAAPDEIDTINILQATLLAMRRAVNALKPQPGFVLIDGNQKLVDCPIPQRAIVKGDQVAACISAASIIAKVTRDRLMTELDSEFPGYDFAKHKGYDTQHHRDKLNLLGPCPAHRRSFNPVALAEKGCLKQWVLPIL